LCFIYGAPLGQLRSALGLEVEPLSVAYPILVARIDRGTVADLVGIVLHLRAHDAVVAHNLLQRRHATQRRVFPLVLVWPHRKLVGMHTAYAKAAVGGASFPATLAVLPNYPVLAAAVGAVIAVAARGYAGHLACQRYEDEKQNSPA